MATVCFETRTQHSRVLIEEVGMLRCASSRWVMGAAAGHWDEMEMEMDDITLIIHCDDGTGKCTGMRCPARDRERHDMNDESSELCSVPSMAFF